MENQKKTAILGRVTAKSGGEPAMVVVENLMVLFVENGSLAIYYNGNKTVVNRGSILLLNQGVHHIAYNDSWLKTFAISAEDVERSIVNISVNYGVNIDNAHSCDRCRYYNYFVVNSSPILTAFFNSKSDKIDRVAELLFLMLCGDDKCLKSRLARAVDSHNNRFAQTVYNHIFTKSTVTTLADKTNRSVTAFKSAFSRQFHSSPHRWTTELRLTRAKILLQTTDRSISDIARTCAYHNLSHFAKRFKQLYHTTPTAYRKAHCSKQ